MPFQMRYNVLFRQFRLLTAQAGSIPAAIRLIFENCYKIWAIKDSLQRVLDYAANPDKTEYDALAQTLHYAENDAKTKLNESAQLVTGIHCRVNHAWEDMRAVQERFGKTDGVVALHAYQSFREGEVTPEQCHEIGVALARKVWGKRFQVLVATHMNTDNLHNHFVINSGWTVRTVWQHSKSCVPLI